MVSNTFALLLLMTLIVFVVGVILFIAGTLAQVLYPKRQPIRIIHHLPRK